MPWSVIGNGGVIGASDGTFGFSATVGQSIIGPATDGTQQLYQGFWVPLPLTTTSVENGGGASGEAAFGLRNYPNPFSSTTTISYRLEERSRVTLEIYDLLGKRVATVADEVEESGSQYHEWNGYTGSGMPAAGGYYLYSLTVEPAAGSAVAGNKIRIERRKLLLVR